MLFFKHHKHFSNFCGTNLYFLTSKFIKDGLRANKDILIDASSLAQFILKLIAANSAALQALDKRC
jgi:hypothetical protein